MPREFVVHSLESPGDAFRDPILLASLSTRWLDELTGTPGTRRAARAWPDFRGVQAVVSWHTVRVGEPPSTSWRRQGKGAWPELESGSSGAFPAKVRCADRMPAVRLCHPGHADVPGSKFGPLEPGAERGRVSVHGRLAGWTGRPAGMRSRPVLAASCVGLPKLCASISFALFQLVLRGATLNG